MKKIAVLGSTGSIGTQTLDIVRQNADIEITSMACGHNIDLFEKQIREFHPSLVSVWEEKDALELKKRLSGLKVRVEYGMDGLIAAATDADSELVVTAMVGMIGIRPTIAAIQFGKNIALANKETLVTAGHIIIPMAKEYHVDILPIDSEHSAIFQCLNGERDSKIERILLTASGGPFRGMTRIQTSRVTVEDALKHPNWSMGKKITIDSATMVNKGLEVIEAQWLFGVRLNQIQVVVQPTSVIHSMVMFDDGAIIAQMGTADMHLPIQYALTYPKRRILNGERLDFAKIAEIHFENPDFKNFPGLALAYEAQDRGGNMPVIYNAANEVAVSLFLAKKIGFNQITDIIYRCMTDVSYVGNPSLDEIFATEKEVREYILSSLVKQ